MLKTLMAVAVRSNVLVPGWITICGVVSLSAPPLGVAASLSLFTVGVLVIPALALIPRAVRARALARFTSHTV
jgi:hypothetical protein